MNSIMKHRAMLALAAKIFEHPRDHAWSWQGFGMLRTDLGHGWRLHVWDTVYSVPNVSIIHDHPWDFESLVLVGTVVNERYEERSGPTTHKRISIKPGQGLQILSEPEPVHLVRVVKEYFEAGQTYHQRANEIHASRPSRYAVTLVHRVRQGRDVARVWFDADKQFVSAEPVLAPWAVVNALCRQALEGVHSIMDAQ